MYKHILPLLLLLPALASCSDFLSAYSQDMIVAKQVSDLDEVLLGECYIKSWQISSGPSGTRVGGFLNILDDDVSMGDYGTQTSRTWGDCTSNIFGYYAWQMRVGSNYNGSYFQADDATWNDLYHRINVINILLDEITDLPHQTNDDLAAWLRVRGEAHFLRAQFFLILAGLYGDAYDPQTAEQKPCVPLKLTPYVEHDKEKDTQFQRASVAEVYRQIEADLAEAEQLLTSSPQRADHRLHRASLEAVQLLQSRVSLYRQDWAEAEKKAEAVCKSQNFTLADLGSFDATFLTRENPEIIFSQGPNNLTSEEIFTGQAGDFCVSSELRSLYQNGDRRADCFFGQSLGDSIRLVSKYERGDITCHISDCFTLRMAEAYLNQAEACAMQGKEREANQLLSTLRRMRIVDYQSGDSLGADFTGEELIKQVRLERRKELCFEGHRWFDLRRYAVCERYPYQRAITHTYHTCGNHGVEYSAQYVLLPGDPAYTFALPESVVEFDREPMVDNLRQERPAVEPEEQEPGDEEFPPLPEIMHHASCIMHQSHLRYKSMKYLLSLLTALCLLTACSDEDALRSDIDFRLPYDLQDNPQDSIAHRRYLIYQETGVPVFFNDTLSARQTGVSSDGLPIMQYETLDLNWSFSSHNAGRVQYIYDLITDPTEQSRALDFVQEFLRCASKPMRPFSILLTRNLTIKDNKGTESPAFHSGFRTLVLPGCDSIQADSVPLRTQEILRSMVKEKVLGNSAIVDEFGGVSGKNKYYNKPWVIDNNNGGLGCQWGLKHEGMYWRPSNLWDEGKEQEYVLYAFKTYCDTPEIFQAERARVFEQIGRFGFIGGNYTDKMDHLQSPKNVDEDLRDYIDQLLSLGHDTFLERYGESPLVVQKFNILYNYIDQVLQVQL